MQALTAIAGSAYAIGLWMFAPRTVWEREVQQAKRNQNRSTATPEPIPQPQTEPIQEPETVPTPEPIVEIEEQPQPEVEPEPESIPEAIEQAIPETTGTNYTTWTTAQLREEAKQRKLQWRPLINGKRKPLNKPQLIELLTA
ncbi:hypothetical protein [Planktothrix sp.]|uniref:hypothetical protein n=1 Tax=Planktothrix sp. TaxID=3088171 RepID=UPI0038D3DBF2